MASIQKHRFLIEKEKKYLLSQIPGKYCQRRWIQLRWCLRALQRTTSDLENYHQRGRTRIHRPPRRRILGSEQRPVV